MSIDFSDLHPAFRDFGRAWENDVQPGLREMERERRHAIRWFWNRVAYSAAAGLVIAGLLFFFLRMPPLSLFIFVAVTMALSWLAWHPLKNFNQRAYDFVLAKVLDVIDVTYSRAINRPLGFEAFLAYKLVPESDRDSFEDMISGTRHGVDFCIYEAKLEKEHYNHKGGKTWNAVFRGQLMTIDYPAQLEGKTVIARDMSWLNRFSQPCSEYQRVGIASERFEKVFEVWSTDQVEARALLDPVVLERFLKLEELYAGKKPRIALVEGTLLMAVETGDVLQAGSVFKPLDSPERIEHLLREFTILYELVDLLIEPIAAAHKSRLSLDN